MSMHPEAAAVALAAVDPLFYLFLTGALPFLALAVYLTFRPSPLDRKEGDPEGVARGEDA